MTVRERWLMTGLVLLLVLVPSVALWGHVRYQDAQEAVRRFVEMEDQAEKGDLEETALLRQARPEIRRRLAGGDFTGALQRLAALRAEDGAVAAPAVQGQELGVDQLWPPRSAERERVRGVLKTLVEKQERGYDTMPAQESLVRVARLARAGKRKQALAAFRQVEERLQAAALRPGFKPPEGQSGSQGPGGSPATGALPPMSEAQLAQFLQMVRVVLPRMMEQATPEQRHFLERLEPFANELAAAHRQGKDIRPAMALLGKMKAALDRQDLRAAHRLLDRAQSVLRAAKPIRGRGAAPAPGLRPGPGRPRGPAPGRPLPNPGAPPRELTPDRILRALDMIRGLPEPVYRQQRGQLARFLTQAIGGAGGKRGPATAAVGNAAGLRLELGPLGEITGFQGQGQALGAGLPPGGFVLAREGGPAAPLRSPVQRLKDRLIHHVAGPEGTFVATYGQEGEDLIVSARTRRERSGKPAQLLLRIPLRAGGWTWTAGEPPQVVAVEGTYAAAPQPGAPLGPVSLQGAGIALSVTAPSASSVAYDPAENTLLVRFPLPGEKGVTEHTVRLTLGSVER
jgi:hypothetical protein